MSDVAVTIPFAFIYVLGGLVLGGIFYILGKCYVKSRLRKQK